jgi:hypothetical protein
MISVVSIVNDETIAKEFLLRGLSLQDAKFELLLVDNRASIYKSASQALNYASIKANGDYLMFIHQDVFLYSRNWLKEAEGWLSTLSDIGLAGVAGMKKPRFISQFEVSALYFLLRKLGKSYLWFSHYGRGNVFHGPEKASWEGGHISDVIPVQTVDEQLLIVPFKVFQHTKFDETVCNGWHLYGVEFSLRLSQKGYGVYVLPCPVFHRSSGIVNDAYLRTLMKLIRKYKNEKVINTTNGFCPTKQILTKLLWSPNLISSRDLMEVLTQGP